MKRKIYLILIILSFGLLSVGFINNTQSENQNSLLLKDKHPKVDWTIGCTECHEEITPKVFKDWNMSKHGQVGFGCFICHGDGQEEFNAKGKDNGCLGCHSAMEVNFKKTKVKSCFDCHNGHTLKFHN